MTSLIDSENGVEREALAAWHEDRRHSVGERRGWVQPTCQYCTATAVTRLILVWDGRVEQARTLPYCREHMDIALNNWDRICDSFPEAVEGLSLNVGTAW